MEAEHKRAFVRTFRRWAILFKRREHDVEDEKWLIAEYYKRLGHLSEAGLERLTDELATRHDFFPTIRECLAVIEVRDRHDYASGFRAPRLFREGKPVLLLRAAD